MLSPACVKGYILISLIIVQVTYDLRCEYESSDRHCGAISQNGLVNKFDLLTVRFPGWDSID